MKKINYATLILLSLCLFIFNSCKKDEMKIMYKTYGSLTVRSANDFKLYSDNGEVLYGSVPDIGQNTFNGDRFFISYFLADETKQEKEKDIQTVLNLLKMNVLKPYKPSQFENEEDELNKVGSRNIEITDKSANISISRNSYDNKTYINLTGILHCVENEKIHKINMLIDETRSNANELHVLLKHKSGETGNHFRQVVYPASYDISDDYDLSNYSETNPLTIYINYISLYNGSPQQIIFRYPKNK